MGCHFLLQGIFPTQGFSPDFWCLLHWQLGSLPLCHLGNPKEMASCPSEDVTLPQICIYKGCFFPTFSIRLRAVFKRLLIKMYLVVRKTMQSYAEQEGLQMMVPLNMSNPFSRRKPKSAQHNSQFLILEHIQH